MPNQLDELSVAIGGLQADIRHLSDKVENHLEETTREQRKVHDIVDATADAIRTLNSKVSEMYPLVMDYREKRAEKRGAKRYLQPFYVTAGGIAGAITAKLFEVFISRPHP